jgi:hypothetical protein
LFTVADNEKTKGVMSQNEDYVIQMGYTPGRLVHREFESEDLQLKDTPVKMTVLKQSHDNY